MCLQYAHQMPHMCHKFQLADIKISVNYISIYTSYEVAAINIVTKSTDTHFTLLTCAPEYNIPNTLHLYLLLH